MKLHEGLPCVCGNLQGIIRYVGRISSQSGTLVGIELPTPTGDCDGEIGGKRYFRTAAMHACFREVRRLLLRTSTRRLHHT